MRPEQLALDLKATTKFTQSTLQRLRPERNNDSLDKDFEECIGGVIRNGQFSWVAVGPNIEIFSMKTGSKVASYTFDSHLQRSANTLITCVTEVNIPGVNSCILVIGVQCSPIGGLIFIFSVQGSRIIHRVEVIDKVTSCCFISPTACQRGSLNRFDGCVAVGTDSGKVFLLDLNLQKCKEILYGRQIYNYEADVATCHIVMSHMKYDEMVVHHKQARRENMNFGIHLEVLQKAGPILSILSMAPLLTLAVGLEDGQMLLYALNDLQAFHLAYPPEINSPLVKLTYLEPADDPRACVYVWAFHANANTAVAVMHSIAFETKTLQDDEYIYENFQSCSPRLTIPICEKGSVPITCQSISKMVSDEEDEVLSLCLLGWTSKQSPSSMFVFDLNQWYKEQMPYVCDWTEYPSYLAPFPVNGKEVPLDIWLDQKSVATFNSIQRPEEHFYPSSLSFDCFKLTPILNYKLHWPGLQNKALDKLSSRGALAILEPDECFTDILETSLIPQFSDHNYHSNPPTRIKQEFLLSMALEYNCMGLLKECAKLWADGSHQGNSVEGLSLSTLTDWIWTQATAIKDCCNNLCVSLFDHSGCTLDLRSRKILSHCSRQLKLLADLLNMVVTNCRQYIPNEIYDTLVLQRNSIRMTSEYQEVLQWLLNMGLLPEVPWSQFSRTTSQLSVSYSAADPIDGLTPVPFPYRILHDYYTAQRQKFFEIDRNLLTPKTNSCKCLYIDTFIENECNSHQLRAEWRHGVGDGLYPPPSLQAMLRILLVPGVPLENKYMLFVYLFLDLNMALEDERYARVVQNLIKFPAVFKLSSSLIKTTQAFWNLDHKEFETAIDELVSPLSNERYISQWQQELLISSLIIQDMPHLALRALRAPGPRVSPLLEIKTLLANNLVTEAFELQRAKRDEELLLEFYRGCHEQKKWGLVLGLALTVKEGEILGKFLRNCDTSLTENLQFLYLLQRNKYIEALSYLEQSKYKDRSQTVQQRNKNQSQNLIFSAFKLAMAPSEKKLSDIYLSIKGNVESVSEEGSDEHQNLRSPKPLSSEMSKKFLGNKLNVFGGIFHRAVVSSKEATNHWFQPISNENGNSYVPFLTKPQIDFDYIENNNYTPVTNATAFVASSKRRKDVSFDGSDDSEFEKPVAKRKRTDSFSMAAHVLRNSSNINKTLLTSFKDRKDLTPLRSQANTIPTQDRSSSDEDDDTYVNLLSTPVVSSARNDKGSPNRSERGRPETPQSILKTRKADASSCSHSRRSISPTLTAGSARRSVDFDEKSFRYSLNQRAYTSLDASDDFPLTTIPESIDGNVSDSNSNSNSSYTRRIKARPPIHSNVTDTSVVSNSADEYYSPDNSKHSELEDALVAATRNRSAQNLSEANLSLSTRQSRSPSMDSTLETETKRMTRSQSRQLSLLNEQELDESLEDNVFTKAQSSTPYRIAKPKIPLEAHKSPKKSLSRIVVEASARKLISGRVNENKNDEVSVTNESYLEDSTDFRQKKEENILLDNSDLSESVLNRYRKQFYSSSCSSTDVSSRNYGSDRILEDSSSFNISVDQRKSEPKEDPSNNETVEDIEDKKEEQATEPDVAYSESSEKIGSDFLAEAEQMEVSMEDKEAADNMESKILASTQTITSLRYEVIEILPASEVAMNVGHVSDGDPANPELDRSEQEDTGFKSESLEISQSVSSLNQMPDNLLQDNSVVSETFMNKYMEQFNSSSYIDPSFMYGQYSTPFLEDSSFGPILQTAAMGQYKEANEGAGPSEEAQQELTELKSATSEDSYQRSYNTDEVQSENEGLSRENKQEEFMKSTESDSSNDGRKSEDEYMNLAVTDSESDDSDSLSNSTDENDDDEDDFDVDTSEHEPAGEDVISISSSSDDEKPGSVKEEKDSETEAVFVQPSEVRFENSGLEYDVADFEMPANKVSEGFSNDQTQSNVLNEMIYGDLDMIQAEDEDNNYEAEMESGISENLASNVADANHGNITGIVPLDSTDVLNVGQIVQNEESNDEETPEPEADTAAINPSHNLSEDIEHLCEGVVYVEKDAEPENKLEITEDEKMDIQDASVDLSKIEKTETKSEENVAEKSIADENTISEDTNALDVAIFLDSTPNPSSTETDLVVSKEEVLEEADKSVQEEPEPKKLVPNPEENKITTTPIKKKIPVDDQQPSTSKVVLRRIAGLDVAPAIADSPSRPSQRTRSSSLSVDQSPITNSPLRSSRAKSVSSTNVNNPTVLIRRRASSTKLETGDITEKDISVSSATKPKLRRLSVLLDSAPESPKTPTRGRKKNISESSEIEKSTEDLPSSQDVKSTPKRSRKGKETSDTESILSTPSRKSVDRGAVPYGTPNTRSRSKLLEQESPEVHEDVIPSTPTRRSSRSKSKQTDDDARSEVSSIASSTKSRTKRKGSAPPEDDELERGSIKSGRSRRSIRGIPAVLPSIAEDETDKTSAANTPNIEYSTSSRRLTRSQLATMEKYSAENRQKSFEGSPGPSRIMTRRKSANLSALNEDAGHADDSDAESIESKDSRMSTQSKASKASKVSKASRTSKRQRPTVVK